MLWEAAHRGKLEMVKYLVRRKADLDACGTHYTPYFVEISCYCIAQHKKHQHVAEYLLSKGAKVDIHTAAFLGDLTSVRKILKRRPNLIDLPHDQHDMADKNADGIDFIAVKKVWATPLCYALRGGSLETIQFLIDQGAQIQGIEKELFIAADEEFDRVKLLLENGANPKQAGWAHSDESELFELLSSYGVSQPSDAASEDLVYLCRGDRGGNYDEVKRLLQLGANVDFQDHKGKTALHRASKSGFVDVVKLLLKEGASVDIGDNDDETCLFDAARSTIKLKKNKLAAVQLLLEAGASPDHVNRRGQRLPELLKRSKLPESNTILKLLKKFSTH